MLIFLFVQYCLFLSIELDISSFLYLLCRLCCLNHRFCVFLFFFFKKKPAYEMRISDWSSDVCSSDLYAISGDRPAWRPVRAFDDGAKTYVEFPPSLGTGEAPPLFVVGTDGKAELVNYRLRGRFYVVDRIFDAAELRLGLKKQQVVRIDRVRPFSKRRGA